LSPLFSSSMDRQSLSNYIASKRWKSICSFALVFYSRHSTFDAFPYFKPILW
jgi:hypothetical protein